VLDKEPYGNPPLWSSSLWWVSSCMDPNVVAHSSFPTYEGVEPKRHLDQAVVSFNDGHSDARKSETINPPANPADGTAKSLINSKHWGPAATRRPNLDPGCPEPKQSGCVLDPAALLILAISHRSTRSRSSDRPGAFPTKAHVQSRLFCLILTMSKLAQYANKK
jgi:hypothetical protein